MCLGHSHHRHMPVVHLSNFDPLFLGLFSQQNTFDVLDLSRRKRKKSHEIIYNIAYQSTAGKGDFVETQKF